ncbi:MAG: DUF402 domain-containing protein [Nocardioides sp.]
MSEPLIERSGDHAVSASGGTMRRLTEPPADSVDSSPELGLLASLRRVVPEAELRAAVGSPYFDPGDVLTWHYGASLDVLRVVQDDERGLVAWLPAGSERLAPTARDGRGLRERSLAERTALAVDGEYDLKVVPWHGAGLLRIAPAGRAWSIWYFREDDGTFAGHYLNLELPHERPVDRSRRIHTRDLTLDLWVDATGTWLKDADELEAGVAGGWCSAEQAAVIHDVADQARREQVDGRGWPLDERWEDWQPSEAYDEPLSLPEKLVDELSKSGHVVRRG